MTGIRLTKSEARSYLVKAHMHSGSKLKKGRVSINRIIRSYRSVQVDTINVCRTNQDICFSSRIGGFTPDQLEDVLYGKKRTAHEYWSKCLCILPNESRPW